MNCLSPVSGDRYRMVNRKGEIVWKGKRLYISKALIGDYVALRQIEEPLWEILFGSYSRRILNEATGKIISHGY